jgi:hypothetical protein
MSQLPAVPVRIFSSSRWTFGNFFFPDKLVLNTDEVVFKKSHLIGGEEESIRYEQIASVSVQSGVFFAELLFETTGGSEPVFLNGLWKGTAQRAKAELQARIRSRTSGRPDPVLKALEKQTQVLEAILGELQRK